LITSLTNPIVRQARALRARRRRDDGELFLVEGIRPVGEAVEAGWEIESILYSPDGLTSDFGRSLLARLGRGLQPGGVMPPVRNAAVMTPAVLPVSARVMESLADKDNPQGLLALVHKRRSKLQDVQLSRSGAALVSPQDPGNVGTILRTLDAIGAEALFLLDGGVDPYHPTCVRASMGALFWKPVVQTTLAEFLDWQGRQGCQLIGTSAHAALDYRGFKPRPPFVLLFGSEQKGLSAGQMAACEAVVSLPMRGRASSLNLAVAAGVLLYQFGPRDESKEPG
jgi:RNA methyltransferase, TrmH family